MSLGIDEASATKSLNSSSFLRRSCSVKESSGLIVSTAVRVRSAASFRPTPIDDIRNDDRIVNARAWWFADPFRMRPRPSLDACRIRSITALRRAAAAILFSFSSLSASSNTTGMASFCTTCRMPASVVAPSG